MEMQIKTHPIYDKYEFNNLGQYRMIGNTEWLIGNGKQYLKCTIRSKDNQHINSLTMHRAVYEAFNGKIKDGYEIDHVNSNKTDNRLCNLEEVTMKENRRRASLKEGHKLRDIAKNATKLKRNIKCENVITKEVNIFKSKSQASKFAGCSPALVYNICECKNCVKLFAGTFKFSYADKEEINKIIVDPRIGKTKYENAEVKKEVVKAQVKKHFDKVQAYKTWLQKFKRI